MKKCIKCNCELIEDLNVYAYGAYSVEVSKQKNFFPTNRARVMANVCPQCLEVTFLIDEKGFSTLQK